jgi:hypothetical protein
MVAATERLASSPLKLARGREESGQFQHLICEGLFRSHTFLVL